MLFSCLVLYYLSIPHWNICLNRENLLCERRSQTKKSKIKVSLIENWATNPTYMLVKENKTGILELPFSLFYAVRENMVINNPLFFKKWSFIQRKMFKNYFPPLGKSVNVEMEKEWSNYKLLNHTWIYHMHAWRYTYTHTYIIIVGYIAIPLNACWSTINKHIFTNYQSEIFPEDYRHKCG